MFGFKKKEKKIEDLVSESFDKIIKLTLKKNHEAATKETDKFTKLLEELPGNEKLQWYDKLTTAVVQAVTEKEKNDKTFANNTDDEVKSNISNFDNDNDSSNNNENNDIKVDGSETARQNKIKETLIDPNPVYTKWYNYFWKHKLHEDAQAKKFCPIWYDTMYNQEHRVWNNIDLTENAWNIAAGCIYGDIAPVLNFEAICTSGVRDEFNAAYGLLMRNVDEKKMVGLCFSIKDTDEEITKDFPTMTKDQIEAHDIRYGKCLISLNSDKVNLLSICEKFILKKWEEFCPSSIYDVNPETDTEERYWERRNALTKVYEIFDRYLYYNKNLSNAFAIATEYFEFVEKHNN